jgi:RNA polymerase nonessential primary-like sigma factor
MTFSNHDPSLRKSLLSMGKAPLLTKSENIQLAITYKASPQSPEGLAAKQKMILANLRLIASIAKKYPNKGELIDRLQDGYFGLLTAIEKYDPSMGFAFSTYAYQWIRRSIHTGHEKAGEAVRLPRYQIENLNKMRSIQHDFEVEHHRQPTNAELPALLDISPHTFKLLLEAAKFGKGQVLSTSVLIGKDRIDSLESLLPDQDVDVATDVENHDRAEVINQLLDKALTPRQLQVIEFSYGLNGKPSMAAVDIAKVLGLSRERIRQVREQCLRIIRKNPRLRETFRSML